MGGGVRYRRRCPQNMGPGGRTTKAGDQITGAAGSQNPAVDGFLTGLQQAEGGPGLSFITPTDDRAHL